VSNSVLQSFLLAYNSQYINLDLFLAAPCLKSRMISIFMCVYMWVYQGHLLWTTCLLAQCVVQGSCQLSSTSIGVVEWQIGKLAKKKLHVCKKCHWNSKLGTLFQEELLLSLIFPSPKNFGTQILATITLPGKKTRGPHLLQAKSAESQAWKHERHSLRRCDGFQGDSFELAVTQKSNLQICFLGGGLSQNLDVYLHIAS